MSNFWIFYFASGLASAVIWQLWHIVTFKGEVKTKKDETWSSHLGGLLAMVAFGFMSLIMTVPMILESALEKWPSLWKPFVYLCLTILVIGCMSEVTKVRIGAICEDGAHSSATGRGACSWHGGVKDWEYKYWWE